MEKQIEIKTVRQTDREERKGKGENGVERTRMGKAREQG